MAESNSDKKVSIHGIVKMKRDSRRIVVVTAYDVLFARLVDNAEGKRVVANDSGVTLDYLSVVDQETFENPDVAQTGNSAIIAARVGSTRLIDNMTLGRNDQD